MIHPALARADELMRNIKAIAEEVAAASAGIGTAEQSASAAMERCELASTEIGAFAREARRVTQDQRGELRRLVQQINFRPRRIPLAGAPSFIPEANEPIPLREPLELPDFRAPVAADLNGAPADPGLRTDIWELITESATNPWTLSEPVEQESPEPVEKVYRDGPEREGEP